MISILMPNAQEEQISRTLEQVERYFPEAQVIIATDRDRRGKGWAMRQALSQATGDIICFLDGDGDISAMELNNILPFLGMYDIVCGVKTNIGLKSRKLITLFSRLYIKIMFGLNDTQTGIKAFRKDALKEWKEDGWLFDVEILYNAKKAGKTITHVPIIANVRSRQNVRAIIYTLIDSFKLFVRLRLVRK